MASLQLIYTEAEKRLLELIVARTAWGYESLS